MSKKKKIHSSIEVIELNAYTTPKIEEVRNSDFVDYGVDNLYFQYLIDRYIGSTTNQAIIKGTATKIYGKGLCVLNEAEIPLAQEKIDNLIVHSDLRKLAFDRKLLGMAALQIQYNKGKVAKVSHFPMETLRAGKIGDSGKVEKWYYHPSWKDYKKSDNLKEFPIFGSTKSKKTEIYILSPYTSGYYYYSPVDYAGALSYAYLEEIISEYLINDALNGFSGTKVINMNNGVPDSDQQRRLKQQLLNKFTGQHGDKVVVSFNANKESATTVENLPLDNAPEHYAYLADECRNKLITGHNVTSPLLLGVRDGSGFSSNADEIKNSSLFFNNTVIKVYQEEITDALEEIFAINGIDAELYFKTIQPLEFIDTDNMDDDTAEEETGIDQDEANLALSEEVELSYNDYPQGAKNNAKRALKYKKENGSSCGTSVGWTRANQLANGENISRDTISRMASFKRHQQHKDVPYTEGCGGLMWDAWGGSAGVNWAISKLKQIDKDKLSLSKEGSFTNELIEQGEFLDASEWELIDERDVDLETEEELDSEVASWNAPKEEKLSLLQRVLNLASTGTARPNSKSEQDKTIEGDMYKVRYKYVGNPNPQREFCRMMMSAGKLYRKEDIIAMGSKAVNAGFGIAGADTYSIWEFKGGARCHHKWQRLTFKSRSKTIDVKSPNAPKVSTNQAEREGYRVRNPKNVSIKPKDMPSKGFYNG